MTRSQTRNQIVSSDAERLVLVDSNDRELGTSSKADCHDGAGILHRAFSLFVFNEGGALLIHQRHADKRLWPLFWSNSCCSHPHAGEDMELAVGRRLEQELGLRAALRFMYKFEYAAAFGDIGSEHELCWVYAGMTRAEPVVNATEVAAWRWIMPAALDAELAETPDCFTPWFKLEWQALRGTYRVRLEQAIRP